MARIMLSCSLLRHLYYVATLEQIIHKNTNRMALCCRETFIDANYVQVRIVICKCLIWKICALKKNIYAGKYVIVQELLWCTSDLELFVTNRIFI